MARHFCRKHDFFDIKVKSVLRSRLPLIELLCSRVPFLKLKIEHLNISTRPNWNICPSVNRCTKSLAWRFCSIGRTDSRRRIGVVASSLAANLLWSPFARGQAEGKGHDDYFAHLNGLLKEHGPGRPVMLLDKRFVNHNIDQLVSSVGEHKQYRVVVKSLPSVPLLAHVLQRSKSNALMVFHQPFLNEVAKTFPQADVLIGKPMPVQAAKTF